MHFIPESWYILVCLFKLFGELYVLLKSKNWMLWNLNVTLVVNIDLVFLIIYSEIEPKEARLNAMRSAILETFPEPNRRLLQRLSLSLNPPPPLLSMWKDVLYIFVFYSLPIWFGEVSWLAWSSRATYL